MATSKTNEDPGFLQRWSAIVQWHEEDIMRKHPAAHAPAIPVEVGHIGRLVG